MSLLRFELPDNTVKTVHVKRVLNAGFAGRDQRSVAAHAKELAEMGIAGPDHVPTLYQVAPSTVTQQDVTWSQNHRTSGEVEWVLVVSDDGELFLTVGSDHTDRALEVHGIPWGKQITHDVVAATAWPVEEVREHLDDLQLSAWVHIRGEDLLMQQGSAAELLPLEYWLEYMKESDLLEPGTVLFAGTLPMIHPERQFTPEWTVRLADPILGRQIQLSYRVETLCELRPPSYEQATEFTGRG